MDNQQSSGEELKTSGPRYLIKPPTESAFGGIDGIYNLYQEADSTLRKFLWSGPWFGKDHLEQVTERERSEQGKALKAEMDRLYKAYNDWQQTDGGKRFNEAMDDWRRKEAAAWAPIRNAECRASLPKELASMMRQRERFPDKTSGIPARYKSVNIFDLQCDIADYNRTAELLLTLYPLPHGPPFESIAPSGILNTLIAINGNRGTGKTHLACGLLNLFQAGGRKGNSKYRRAADLFVELKSTFNDKSKSQGQLIAEWVDADFLVIDEMQQRSGTPFEDALLVNLIDQRYGAMRPTLLIANYKDAKDFDAQLDPSVVSRLQECGGIIEANWPSFRAR